VSTSGIANRARGAASGILAFLITISLASCIPDGDTSESDPAEGGGATPAPSVEMDTTAIAPPPSGGSQPPGAPPPPQGTAPAPGNPWPEGLPSVEPAEEKPGSRMLTLGNYQLAVPKGSAVRSRPDGTIELTRGSLTAQIRPIAPLPSSSASDLFVPIRGAWNPVNPLLPIGQPEAPRYEHLGGSAMQQRYNQPMGGSDVDHGIFLLHVSSESPPEAIGLDVFSDGPAQSAHDWEALSGYARTIMENLRFRGSR
jgi:hypothetical protein